jgi:AmiR/NasT family two-component response regulator
LTAGLIGALTLRAKIERAISVIMSADETDTGHAYLTLCTRADEAGTSLVDTAPRVLRRHDLDRAPRLAERD